MVRQSSELETNVVAVERTKEYTETPNEVRRNKFSRSVLLCWTILSPHTPRLRLLLKTIVLALIGQREVM